MTQTPSSGTARRAAALIVIPALMLLLGVIGVVSIDQGRSGATTISVMADQTQRLNAAALTVESARHLAAAGQPAEARKSLDAATSSIRAAVQAENSADRRARIEALLPMADVMRPTLDDAKGSEAAGAALIAELGALGHLADQDLLEAEAEVPAAMLQTAALFGVVVLILAAAATFTAFLAVRTPRS